MNRLHSLKYRTTNANTKVEESNDIHVHLQESLSLFRKILQELLQKSQAFSFGYIFGMLWL